jgi:predicted methyltransferase
MRTHVTVSVVAILLSGALANPAIRAEQRGGQQGLTEGQIQSAAIEVPRLMALLALEPSMTVADVGAGFGAWTAAFAKALGPSGRVYATEIGPRQLETLRAAAAGGLANLTVLEGAERSTNLPAACCDAILIRDVYHHLTQPADIVRSLVAALKPGGRLAVIDFPPVPGTPVSAGVPANRGGHGVPPEVVIEEVTAAGLVSVSVTRDWSGGSGPGDLFLLVFEKP